MTKNMNATCRITRTTTSLIFIGLLVLLCRQSSVCSAAEPDVRITALRKAIEHLGATHGEKYPGGADFLKRLEDIDDPADDAFVKLQKEALLANPLVSANHAR